MLPYHVTRAMALATLVLTGPAAIPSAAEPPDTGESLLPRILSRLESDLDALRSFSFREEKQVERRSRTGDISSRERELSEVFHQDGLRMRRTLANGQASEPRTDEEPSPDLKDLASCFTYSTATPAMLAERPALRLDFAARSGCLQTPGRAERILGNLEGRLWVDPEGYDLLRIEGHLRAPVTFGFGLLGKVESFELEVEREAVSPGVFAMTRLEYHAQGRIFPARRFDLRNRRDRSSFQRVSDDALSSAATTPSPPRSSDPDPDRRNRS
ncbi:MAG TPA: hypothetical protein VFG08_05555 [Candidatus Polarisedimenticolia bacterium]|nr:hypothetical protein [Candidatus Polarisedimenticolia bacterium]